jgi:hypothetical protein
LHYIAVLYKEPGDKTGELWNFTYGQAPPIPNVGEVINVTVDDEGNPDGRYFRVIRRTISYLRKEDRDDSPSASHVRLTVEEVYPDESEKAADVDGILRSTAEHRWIERDDN